MAEEIELICDAGGFVVLGNQGPVERFLNDSGLASVAMELDLSKLSGFLKASAGAVEAASVVMEQSARYLKLTPESASKLKEAGGLMRTKVDGISHAMLGDPGKIGKWLQVEDDPAALVTNPALLSGMSGLMSQVAQQSEARELKALLVQMDEKLDDVKRRQRDEVLARMASAADAISEAMSIRAEGGDPQTSWDKVSGVSTIIMNVQRDALLAVGALADKIEGKTKVGDLKKSTKHLGDEVALQLTILARCFELQDEFDVIELDHVLVTAPDRLAGHRRGKEQARSDRRVAVFDRTGRLLREIDAAASAVNENVVLHALAARAVIDSVNEAAATVHDFHAPIGIAVTREEVHVLPWRQAIRDPRQLQTAGTELGKKASVVAGGAAVTAAGIAAVGRGSDSQK